MALIAWPVFLFFAVPLGTLAYVNLAMAYKFFGYISGIIESIELPVCLSVHTYNRWFKICWAMAYLAWQVRKYLVEHPVASSWIFLIASWLLIALCIRGCRKHIDIIIYLLPYMAKLLCRLGFTRKSTVVMATMPDRKHMLSKIARDLLRVIGQAIGQPNSRQLYCMIWMGAALLVVAMIFMGAALLLVAIPKIWTIICQIFGFLLTVYHYFVIMLARLHPGSAKEKATHLADLKDKENALKFQEVIIQELELEEHSSFLKSILHIFSSALPEAKEKALVLRTEAEAQCHVCEKMGDFGFWALRKHHLQG